MSNLANVDTLEGICPQCSGSMVLLLDECVCSQCGFRLLRWFDPEIPLLERAKEFHMKLKKIIEKSEGSKGLDPDSSAFLELNTGFLELSRPLKASESDHVPEAKEADISPRQPLALPRLPAPFTLTTNHELRKLMKGNCLQDEAPRRQWLTHSCPTSAPSFSSSSFARCSSEAQQKSCTSVVPDLICDIDIDDPAMDEFGSPRCPDPIKRDCGNCEIAKSCSKLWSRGP